MATQAEIDALRDAAVRGVTEVRHADGRMVKYVSPEDMLRVAGLLEARITTVPMMRTTKPVFERD